MLPFLIFMLSLQPRLDYNCSPYPSTGPTCSEFGWDPDTPWNHYYECTVQGAGDCTYYVGTNGRQCRCYEFKPNFQEILCPWHDCDGGKCKTCQIDKVRPGETWGGVKQLYR